RVPESNRCTRICNPLRNHSANSPKPCAVYTMHLDRATGSLIDWALLPHHFFCVKTAAKIPNQ
ncbi:MAG: hypothetical protein KUG58_06535, partial [Marinosulfonomonas sp.]|nr:hypothetical protein [Marinosulfonomonas sp.]